MSPDMIDLLIKSFWETCYMVFASTALSTLIGIPLGVILTVTRRTNRLTLFWVRLSTQRVPLLSLY